MNDEQRQHYDMLHAATDEAWDHQESASGDLITTTPTTLTGVVALCRYVEPMLNDPDDIKLPGFINWDDETQSTPAGALADLIATALEPQRLATHAKRLRR